MANFKSFHFLNAVIKLSIIFPISKVAIDMFFFCYWRKWKYKKYICGRLPSQKWWLPLLRTPEMWKCQQKVMRVILPGASACAVTGSVSDPASAPSFPGPGFRPLKSSFTVYTNNSIYNGITPLKEKQIEDVIDSSLKIKTTFLKPSHGLSKPS